MLFQEEGILTFGQPLPQPFYLDNLSSPNTCTCLAHFSLLLVILFYGVSSNQSLLSIPLSYFNCFMSRMCSVICSVPSLFSKWQMNRLLAFATHLCLLLRFASDVQCGNIVFELYIICVRACECVLRAISNLD